MSNDEHAARLTAWVDGALVPVAEARVSVFDRAFRGGEGVFETLRAYGSHVFRLDRHLDRALAGADMLGFEPPSRQDLTDAVQATVDANLAVLGPDGGAVRLTVTPGGVDPTSPFPGTPLEAPVTVVTVHHLRRDPAWYRDGMAAVTVPWGREVPTVKAVSYVASSLARRRAREAGAQEAIFTDETGHVLEAAAANIFAVIGDHLVTPPVDAGLLPGVTRQATLDVAARVGLTPRERALSLPGLLQASEAFLTATTRELVPLVRVDGHPIGSGRPGDRTNALHRAYLDLVDEERGAASGPAAERR